MSEFVVYFFALLMVCAGLAYVCLGQRKEGEMNTEVRDLPDDKRMLSLPGRPTCSYCHSPYVVRNGRDPKGRQRWICRNCEMEWAT